jgi:hypothetical protein
MPSDRYQVYELKGHHVRATIPPRFGGGIVRGLVTGVYRDVIAKTVVLTLGNNEQKVVFREPSDVVRDAGEIAFVYREFPEADPQPIDGVEPEVEVEPPVVAVISFEVEGLEETKS